VIIGRKDDAQNFYEAREIVGQHDLGKVIEVAGENTIARREFGTQMFARGKALAIMSARLGYFALHQYDQALATFQTGMSISGWEDDQGKKVLYTMTGFAAGKVGDSLLDQGEVEKARADFDLAQEVLQKALVIDPGYARPYIGIANLNYMRALIPYKLSKNYQDVDNALLDQCLADLDQAVAAPNKPPLAEAETKIHFARGQCLLLKAFSGAITAQPAFDEFQLVVQAYGDGKNPRVQELAAEAHARLGLIYRLLNKNDQALIEYQAAADLLTDYPERQAVYATRVADLSIGLTPTP
jgi:tetratricopeptide (TPR) repeat protein